MKRVLHVLNSLERSGMEIMLLCSYQQWLRRGYRCDIVATATEVGPLAQSLTDAGYAIHHLPMRGSSRHLLRLRFCVEFFNLCRSGYDVVHIHPEAGVPLFALLARLAGVRRIAVTPHNTFLFDGALRIRKIFERAFVRMLGGRYGMISEGVARCERERFHNHGVRTWNWLDEQYYRPPTSEERDAARSRLGCGPDDFVLVSVGNCNGWKNHPALLRALSLLPTTQRPLYIHVGREDREQSERSLAKELAIEDAVRFVGSQPDPRLFHWAADAYAMPSTCEGLGISTIEAIACGVPSVLTEIDGIKDIAEQTQYSIMTDCTSDSVAEGLRTLLALSPDQRKRRAQVDSDLVRGSFSVAKGVDSIIVGLYEETGVGRREEVR